jgi:hypothetical protein
MSESNIILYKTPNGQVSIQVQYEDGSFWLTQKRMAELFGVDVRTINEHLQNIYKNAELQQDSTTRKIRIVQQEGKREVSRELDFHNPDAIIAVGYRVNSYQATQFRIWATNTLKEFIVKGFVLPFRINCIGQLPGKRPPKSYTFRPMPPNFIWV